MSRSGPILMATLLRLQHQIQSALRVRMPLFRSETIASWVRSRIKYGCGSRPIRRANRYSEAYCQVLEADRVGSPL